MTPSDRFELVARLYYAATGYLRPGKSNPPETGLDSNSDENRERFENYCATKLLADALAKTHELEIDVDAVRDERDELRTALAGLGRYESFEMAYMGGHAGGEKLEAFQQGMHTVCSGARAVLGRIRETP